AFSYFVGSEFKLISAELSNMPVTGKAIAAIPDGSATSTAIVTDPSFLPFSVYGGEAVAPAVASAPFNPFPLLSGIGSKGGELTQKLLEFINIKEIKLSSGVIWTVVVFAVVGGLAWSLNGHDADEALFWAKAASGTTGAGLATYSLSSGFASTLGAGAGLATGIGIIAGVAVAMYTFYSLTRRTEQRAVVFNCGTWQAKTGGEDCKKCNDKEFPCTLYQCKSLGQGCELINPGYNARCIYKDPKDNTPPTIKAREDSLLNSKYSYTSIAEEAVRGVEIKYTPNGGTAGCLPSYEIFTFGVELDKSGICKLENKRTGKFADMTSPFGAGLSAKSHTQMMFFPGQVSDGSEIPAGGNYEYYVRCENVNGFTNDGEFLFKFCIDNFPDDTEPEIYGFNFRDKTPLTWFKESDAHETSIKVYTNEQAKCKWSHSDKEYSLMENNLVPADSQISINAQLSYTSSGTLTGLENEKENNFYFRCNDTAGNMNINSKKLTLIGSRPLVIDSVSPLDKSLIKGASNSIKVTLEVKTSAGYENGKADCYYSLTGNYDSYTKFENTRSYIHSHDLYLPEGNYKYYIQCFDMAGNVKVESTSFEVETDNVAPLVTRVYNEIKELKISTNEKSECVYDIVSCSYNFEDGLKLTTMDRLNHYTEWNTDSPFFIKCKDEFGNKPNTDKCSVIARPFSSV
ncbi:MAG: hypothetical protein AABW47_04305, partial [Nanoarchaeota archaeon]